MKTIFCFFSLIGLFSFTACNAQYEQQAFQLDYDLKVPDKKWLLPDTLNEISGLTYLGDNTFACIQDENGIIFIFDMISGSILKQFTFAGEGDYEGITLVNNTLYVLRSDGVIFEIPDYKSQTNDTITYQTNIPAKDNEGLCYDPKNNRLLIGCKSKPDAKPEIKDEKHIYAFDLYTKKLVPKPVFIFKLDELTNYALQNNINLPLKKNKKSGEMEARLKLKTSAIAIHPVNKKLYLLSAAEYLFFIFDLNGNIEYIEQLNPEMFNKAEGITFLKNGDMLISNEGQANSATVLRFNFKK